MMDDIEVIILAAGLSRRMGRVNKLLLDIDGTTMVRRTAQLYASMFSSVTIVLGHERDKVKAALQGLGVRFIYNADYETGHHGSVRCGLEHVKNNGSPVLIALADQPFLTQAELANYVKSFQDSSRDMVFIPFYKEQRGHPVIIPAALLHEFHCAPEDMTLRGFLDANPARVHDYPAPSMNFIKDIDRTEDLE